MQATLLVLYCSWPRPPLRTCTILSTTILFHWPSPLANTTNTKQTRAEQSKAKHD